MNLLKCIFAHTLTFYTCSKYLPFVRYVLLYANMRTDGQLRTQSAIISKTAAATV